MIRGDVMSTAPFLAGAVLAFAFGASGSKPKKIMGGQV